VLQPVFSHRFGASASEERGTRGVRVSTHVFVFQEHVDMLLQGLRAVMA